MTSTSFMTGRTIELCVHPEHLFNLNITSSIFFNNDEITIPVPSLFHMGRLPKKCKMISDKGFLRFGCKKGFLEKRSQKEVRKKRSKYALLKRIPIEYFSLFRRGYSHMLTISKDQIT